MNGPWSKLAVNLSRGAAGNEIRGDAIPASLVGGEGQEQSSGATEPAMAHAGSVQCAPAANPAGSPVICGYQCPVCGDYWVRHQKIAEVTCAASSVHIWWDDAMCAPCKGESMKEGKRLMRINSDGVLWAVVGIAYLALAGWIIWSLNKTP